MCCLCISCHFLCYTHAAAGADCGQHRRQTLLCSDQLEAHKEAAVVGRVGWDLLHRAAGSGAAQTNSALDRLGAGDVVNLKGGSSSAMPT